MGPDPDLAGFDGSAYANIKNHVRNTIQERHHAKDPRKFHKIDENPRLRTTKIKEPHQIS